MLLFGYRGYSDQYPENTMLAFEKAIESGFDGIETDVHKTKDGVLVLCHDEKINRTSNGKGYIKDMTYDELCTYNFGTKENPQRIPALKDLLELCKGKKIKINLEIKTNKIQYSGIELESYQMIKEMGMLDQVLFSSFSIESLYKLRAIDSSLYLGYLFEDDYEKNKQLCLTQKLHVHVREDYLDEDEIALYLKHGLDINTWGVTNRFRYGYFKEKGVNIVIANKNFKKLKM